MLQGPPATDIYLAELRVSHGRASVGVPVNVTARPGYDKQPMFLHDGRAFLYTSIREDSQADIYRYDIARRTSSRVTATRESEYSPTPLPDGTGFSVVRVEADSTQRLWAFDLDGRSEEHTSELQSLTNLVCRLLLEKKKKNKQTQVVAPSPNSRNKEHILLARSSLSGT